MTVDDVLAKLLAAWRTAPTPALHELVVRAGRVAGFAREAVSGLDHGERQRTWLAIEAEAEPADLDRLLVALVDGRCEECTARLERLAARPADPRLVDALVALIGADPDQRRGETSPVPFTSPPNRKFWTTLLPIVEDRGTAAHVAALRAVIDRERAGTFQDWLRKKLARLLPALEARTPPATLPAQLAATVATLEAKLVALEAEARPQLETGADLYAAVWAEPDEDGPRQVLADFLIERGDPRGEFIALQLARHANTLDAAGKKREKELLKRHRKEWLGPIQPLVQPHAGYLRFERGFLVTCSLEPNAELEATLGTHPAWSTIREYMVHDYAKRTAQALAAMLQAHGAVQVPPAKFTRGIA